MNKNILMILALLISTFYTSEVNGQSKTDSLARSILKASLTDKSLHNVLNYNKAIIKDSTTAVATAEPILFGIYGKDNILRQKPYHIYHVDNHWIISGSLPKGSLGGTFLIIFNDRNCKIVRLTHGK